MNSHHRWVNKAQNPLFYSKFNIFSKQRLMKFSFLPFNKTREKIFAFYFFIYFSENLIINSCKIFNANIYHQTCRFLCYVVICYALFTKKQKTFFLFAQRIWGA